MIHTYYIEVTQFEDKTLFQEKLRLLSRYRQQKTAQLKLEKDKCRSLGAGLVLDYALRNYRQGLRERDMEYEFGEWGKPSFHDYPEIHFSLSHSGEYAVCSIGESPVGNDIERIRQGRLKVADRFFTVQELEFLYGGQDRDEKNLACDDDGRGYQRGNVEETTQRMFRIWTMKESFLKVTGRGMTLPLNGFSVLVEEGQKIRVEQDLDSTVYRMKEYQDIPGYRVAVCCAEGSEIAGNMEPAAVCRTDGKTEPAKNVPERGF